ncbi:DUF6169 family protein [Spirosoma soli]|uniref:DUF6169 family protein n=1 Tax=Spirosoma soli TaxID=1770529 RepID=A0ABW5LZ97_9BACT
MLSENINPYKFRFAGDEFNSYLFTTVQGAAYTVKFKPTPYLFEAYSEIREQVYELVIDLTRPTSSKPRLDPAIAVTIAAICHDFFVDKERILLYICETADARHMARVRKFGAWFYEFNDSGFLKIDTSFPDTNGITYYLSLIFRMGHPHRHTIIDEFERLARNYNEDK